MYLKFITFANGSSKLLMLKITFTRKQIITLMPLLALALIIENLREIQGLDIDNIGGTFEINVVDAEKHSVQNIWNPDNQMLAYTMWDTDAGGDKLKDNIPYFVMYGVYYRYYQDIEWSDYQAIYE